MTSIYNSTTTTLLVDTTSTRKIVFLPVASTVGAGRLLWIKDISGNAAVSSIFISTIGMDRIENRFAPSTLFAVMSTSYGSVMMTTDGILNWYFLQHYYRNAVSLGASGGSATGGTITSATISGTSYLIHTFTTVGATSFIVSGSITCDYLVVAGGGGGGTGRGGGGGGGGVLQGSITLTTGTYTITVGDRGNNSVNDLQGGDGGSSSIGALVVTTGGGGGGGWITNAGRNGGSGGGASAGSAASGGTGVAGQGFAGSARLDGNTGGGGGGAGAAASGSTGAIGITSMITGTATNYAGGGGAGAVTGGAIGVAFGGTYQVANGTFGGGNGANTNGTKQSFQDAVANTGGGGGGQEGFQGNSGFGGTGIVIIRYPSVGGQTSFVYFSNMIFKLTAFPSGTIYSDSGGTTLSTVSGGVSLWKDSNNVYNFGLGTAATYALVGSVNAVYFSGSSYLAGSSLALNNLSTYTLETVVYLTSVSITSYFIAKQDNGINSYNRFRVANGVVQWNTFNGSSTITSASALSANQWYHIAVTYDGSIGSIYINGSLSSATSASLSIANDASTTHGNTLGAWTGDGNTFNGNTYMAEFNAYSVCLTAANILSSYNSRKSKYGF
jgi:hypothetical protein